MKTNKTLIWLLVGYIVLQLAALLFRLPLFLLLYVIIYLIALVYAAVGAFRAVAESNDIAPLLSNLVLFLIANLILFVIYVPTLIYNPNINWRLKGEAEQDPMILQVYLPAIFFIIAVVVQLLSAVTAKWSRKREPLQ